MKITNQSASTAVAICGALLVAACGASGDKPDPYNGFVDGSAFDSKLQPTARNSKGPCTTNPCYPTQQGWAHGKKFSFYNLGTVKVSTLPRNAFQQLQITKAIVTANAYDFAGPCTPSSVVYNPLTDAYPSTLQYPVLDSLPLATSSAGVIVLPIVNTFGVSDNSGTGCQYIKTASSISLGLTPGSHGASAGPHIAYRLWAAIDTTTSATSATTAINGASCAIPNGSAVPCPVQELQQPTGTLGTQCGTALTSCQTACSSSSDPTCTEQCQQAYIACMTLMGTGWYKGLQFNYLDGGDIPIDPVQPDSLAYMDGVLVDPIPDPSLSSGPFSNTTDANVVILPFLPGEAGYSPIVRLHDFALPPGGTFGQFTDECPTGQGCTATQVDMTQVQYPANQLIFIVASAP
jgi:hypothetical protein